MRSRFMSAGELPRDIVLDGGGTERSAPLLLQAGPLTLDFVDGALRYIRLGDCEAVRRVYCAVRDANWGTVPHRIENLQTVPGRDSFRLQFDVINQQGEIDFLWHGTVLGEASGRIVFEMRGVARRTFLKNRIGFCILHPMQPCAGRPLEIQHTDGGVERTSFPRWIAPDILFRDISGLRYPVLPNVHMALTFEGDVFEMEDQRNWIDASFKTFCTPLARPFPVEMQSGDRVFQRVTIELEETRHTPIVRLLDAPLALEVAPRPSGRLPELGFGIPGGLQPFTPKEIQRLRQLKPSHLRCDLRLSGDVQPVLSRATDVARQLDTSLELALFLGEDPERELDTFAQVVSRIDPPLARCLVFPAKGWCTTRELAEAVRNRLANLSSAVPFGGGSAANFAELNRQRPPVDLLDFVSWPLQPQEHASDCESLVETLAAHAVTVESARQFTGELPLCLGPMTLKKRVNPYATSHWPPDLGPDALPATVDVRQMSLFGAGWTLGSIKYLAESGVHSATYYELAGWRGVIEYEAGSPLPHRFPSVPGCVFPMYHLFCDLAEFRSASLVPIRSPQPLQVEALGLEQGTTTRVIMANYTRSYRTVYLPALGPYAQIRVLDESSVHRAVLRPEAYRADPPPIQIVADKGLIMELTPCSLMRVDFHRRDRQRESESPPAQTSR